VALDLYKELLLFEREWKVGVSTNNSAKSTLILSSERGLIPRRAAKPPSSTGLSPTVQAARQVGPNGSTGPFFN
jgi:hypothetical protein